MIADSGSKDIAMAENSKHDHDSLLGHESDNMGTSPKTPASGAEVREIVQQHSVFQWWRLELILLLVSLIGFVALVSVLAVMDNKLSRSWGPLTLNSINSMLTTLVGSTTSGIVGAALSQNLWNSFGQRQTSNGLTTRPVQDLQVYDGASRGAAGSLALLWKQGPLSIAALGAIVTILSLAFATFTQQLIITEPRVTRDMAAVAKPFARTQRYAVIEAGFGVEDDITPYSVDYSTLSAILGAGLQGNNALPLQVQCPSGTCTYPTDIPSLAISGSCTDVTDKLDNQGSCKWVLPPCDETTSSGTVLTGTCGAVGDPCTYSLPTGPTLTFQPGYNATKTNDINAIWNVTNLVGTGSFASVYHPQLPSIAYNDTTHSYIMKFAAIGLPPSLASPFIDSTRTTSGGTLPPMQAHECALWLSLNYYDLSVTDGTTKYDVTRSYTEIGGVNFIDSDGFPASDSPYYGLNSTDDISALREAINNLIPFDISYVVADWASPSLYRFTPPGTAGINLLEGVYRHSDNLQNWTMNLARELTNNMAIVTPATQTDQYDGEVFSPKIYFKIRWYWLSLPGVVLVLSYAFLVATIMETRRRLVRPWKANMMVMAFADMDDSVKAKIKASEALSNPGGPQEDISDTCVGLHSIASGEFIFSSSKDAK
ncbi:hypothetical protein GGS24DRAFT_481657 [Hypoxylon argillaceum]|nr:hypothetical protein GGS24DRAFT_481657 [Hypoxylon argillaceum]